MDKEHETHAGIFGTNPDRDDVVDALDKLDQVDRTFAVCTQAIEAMDENGNLEDHVAVLIDVQAMINEARQTLVDAVMRDRVLNAIEANAAETTTTGAIGALRAKLATVGPHRDDRARDAMAPEAE